MPSFRTSRRTRVLEGSRAAFPFLVVLVPLFLAACEEDPQRPAPATTPPDTEIVDMPDDPAAAPTWVELAWKGEDPDGDLVSFEWRISDNGADGLLDVVDTLGLPWQTVAGSDSTFRVSADLPAFPPDLNDAALDSSDWRWWQTHTFQIRAVDATGRRDASPASFDFTSVTHPPSIRLSRPFRANTCSRSGETIQLDVEVDDADPEDADLLEARARWVDLTDPAVGLDSGGCLTRSQFEVDDPYVSAAPIHSTEWQPTGPTRASALRLSADLDHAHLIEIQVRDPAGARNPVRRWGDQILQLLPARSNAPVLELFVGESGPFLFVGPPRTTSVSAATGTELDLRWTADAESYRSSVEEFRYGWGVVDPTDPADPGWAVDWGDHRSVHETLGAVDREFLVAARDLDGMRTIGILDIQVEQP